MGPCDWLGVPIRRGNVILYPADAFTMNPSTGKRLRTTQMTLAVVTAVREDGLSVEVQRRSKKGKPNPKYDRVNVHLSALGMANVTVIA